MIEEKLSAEGQARANAEQAAGDGAAPAKVDHPFRSRHPDGHDWDACADCGLYFAAHPCVSEVILESGPDAKIRCPDGGACHHSCEEGPVLRDGSRSCWRYYNAEPLSGVFPGDQWPNGAKAAQTPDA